MEKIATLLLRFSAPMQAWGKDSKFDLRMTEYEPTKSGVVGLIASAMGIRRSETERLASLTKSVRVGTRVEREGKLTVDFHTVKGKSSYITYRHYLADALFLVGIEAELSLLQQISDALDHPYFPLFFGRRSCPPSGRLNLGIHEARLEDALKGYQPLEGSDQRRVRFVVEEREMREDSYFQRDEPVSFDVQRREYKMRIAREFSDERIVPVGAEMKTANNHVSESQVDYFGELSEEQLQ